MDYNFIGIDLGSKTSLVSHLTRNVNNVILNGIGDRQTPVSVSYSDQQRLFGEKAVLRMKSRPLSTVSIPQRFMTSDQRQIGIENEFTSAKFLDNEFHLEGDNLRMSIAPEQVLTGYLSYLKQMASKNLNKSPTFYTISAPNHAGFKSKKDIHKCLQAAVPESSSIVSEKMAIGLDYLINTSSNKQNQNVLFIDFGHSKITAYALKFTTDSIVEIVEGSYSNLGVRSLDQQLYKHFQSLIKFKLNEKNRIKLRQIAAKTRLILSANSQHTINQDFGDNDFQCKITRQQFEKICSSPFSTIKNFIELIKRDIISKGIKIDRVEAFGGGSRIPAFQQILSNTLKMPIMKSINNDAISRGCALYAHHKQKISKLGKIKLKEIIKSRVRVFISQHRNQPVGSNLDLRRAQHCFENYVVYEPGSYNQQKKLTVDVKRDHSVEIWIVSQQPQPFVEYYNFSGLNKQIVSLICDINVSNGYPRIQAVNGKQRNSSLTKSVDVVYDTLEEVEELRKREEEFKQKDIEIISVQEKRNKVESEVFRVKEKSPQSQRYIDKLGEMGVEELDKVLKELELIQ